MIGRFATRAWHAGIGRTRYLGAMAAPLVLLPPSEGKRDGGGPRNDGGRFASALGPSRRKVLEALAAFFASATASECARLLHAKNELLDRSLAADQALIAGDVLVLPAWQRYSGVVWEHLDPASLPADLRRRILVPSAIYGLNAATDPIANFRLTMSVSLPGIGNVAAFWRDQLTELLAPSRSPIVDLLPEEHSRAFDPSRLPQVVRVRFVRGTSARAVGHHAKAAKGAFARHLLLFGLDSAEEFGLPGWKVVRNASGFEVRALT